jgi:hypothetical protein
MNVRYRQGVTAGWGRTVTVDAVVQANDPLNRADMNASDLA